MPAASDKGSQPYSRAYGYGEMAGAKVAPIISACLYGRRHEQPLSLTYGKVPGVGVALSSHFEKPKGFSVWLATIV